MILTCEVIWSDIAGVVDFEKHIWLDKEATNKSQEWQDQKGPVEDGQEILEVSVQQFQEWRGMMENTWRKKRGWIDSSYFMDHREWLIDI